MKKSLQNSNILEQLLSRPEIAVEQLDLIYVDSDKLSITRQKNKEKFIYLYNNKPLTSKNDIKRIQSLVIPPAWRNVRISYPPNGHLQAIGRDAKNRRQYRYHEVWMKIRNQTKFYKMVAFGNLLPKIRKQVDEDLRQKGWPKTKVLALVIRLMEETHIRIGNEQYARRNKTYGLSTLRKKHLDLEKDKIRFHFTGKKGKKHNITLKNKKLIKLVSKCEEIPGWELFQFYDREGNKQQIDSGMVNEYIHDICGDLFTAKDFRTWAATVVFFETLLDLGAVKEKTQSKKNILKAYDASAKALGNTRNVCRKYYVHPLLESTYMDGSLADTFTKAKQNTSETYFSASEAAILDKISSYEPIKLKIKN